MILCFCLVPAKAQDTETTFRNPQVKAAVDLFRSGNAAGAEAALDSIVAQDPNDAEAHNALGIVCSNQKKFDKALLQFDRAIALQKGYFKAVYNKFYLLISLERIDDAETFLRGIVAAYPKQSDALVNLGALLMQRGKLADAAPLFDQALALDAGDYDALFKKGQLQMLQRNYPAAKTSFEQVLKLKPDFAGAMQGLSIVSEIMEKKKQGYIRIRQIVVPSQSEAESLLAELKNGVSFEELARKHSTDSSAAAGGMIGFVRRGELLLNIENVIFALKEGEISGIVRSARGFHIFMRVE